MVVTCSWRRHCRLEVTSIFLLQWMQLEGVHVWANKESLELRGKHLFCSCKIISLPATWGQSNQYSEGIDYLLQWIIRRNLVLSTVVFLSTFSLFLLSRHYNYFCFKVNYIFSSGTICPSRYSTHVNSILGIFQVLEIFSQFPTKYRNTTFTPNHINLTNL